MWNLAGEPPLFFLELWIGAPKLMLKVYSELVNTHSRGFSECDCVCVILCSDQTQTM